ncbi:UNVERIFIED_CONTAM: hypothetical protein Sindi_0737700 [Sesamum indicum]
MFVAVYFTKLKTLWDELTTLDPSPLCTCGDSKKLSERTASNQLRQFLMGLSDVYDHVRNQVLLMDPLPTVGKAYSMVHRVEKQREVHSGITAIDKEGVMTVQIGQVKRGLGRGAPKKGSLVDIHCEHCKKSGHRKDTCFEINGFPEWYCARMNMLRWLLQSIIAFVQDLQTSHVMAMGRQEGRLYIIDKDTFHRDNNAEETAISSNKKTSKIETVAIDSLWHNRLGHAGIDVIKRLHLCSNKAAHQLKSEVCPLAIDPPLLLVNLSLRRLLTYYMQIFGGHTRNTPSHIAITC